MAICVRKPEVLHVGGSVERPKLLSIAVCAVVRVVGVAAARWEALVETVTSMWLPNNPVVLERSAVVTRVSRKEVRDRIFCFRRRKWFF